MYDWFNIVIYGTLSVLVGLYGCLYAQVQNLKEEIKHGKDNESL